MPEKENIFDLSQPDAIEKLLKFAGTTGSPFVPGEPRLTPYGIALEQDFVPTPTTGLPPIVQLAAIHGQSPHLYNVSSFLYPLGFLAGAGRGLLKYRGLEDEAEKRREEFKKVLDGVYDFCRKQLEGSAGAPEAPAEGEQREYEERGNVPGQRGDAYSSQSIEARLRLLEEESENSRMGKASKIFYN